MKQPPIYDATEMLAWSSWVRAFVDQGMSAAKASGQADEMMRQAKRRRRCSRIDGCCFPTDHPGTCVVPLP